MGIRRRLPPAGVVVAVLVTVPLLAACGEEQPSPRTAEPAPPELRGLRFEEPDGAVFTVEPSTVSCAPSEYAADVTTVQVHERVQGRNIVIEAVPVDSAASFDLPVEAGDMESGPRHAIVFLGGREYEVSTAEERSKGRLEVLEAGCDPARLRLRVSGTLASEYIDGDPLTVSGGVDLGGAGDG